MANEPYRLTQTGAEVQADLNDIEALGLATEETAGKMSAADKTKLDGLPSGTELDSSLSGKVDKVPGKGLSTNDYTDEEKAKVDSAYVKPQTGIPSTDLAEGVIPDVSGFYTKPVGGIPASDLAEGVIPDVSGKADKVSSPTAGNFAGLDSNGNITDSGKKASDFATAAQGAKADTAIQDLSPITDLIPAQASDQNQLADKAFVNSSIGTATATFRGTYNLVSDLSLTTSATREQVATALAGAVSTADNNDYAFVQVPTADVTPTEIARVERYKYNGSAWAFEYALNNSGFTASQWAALNSGITSGLVGKLSALPTNSELTTLLAGKQDKIDSTHKLDYSFLDNTPTIPDAVEANPTVPSGTTPTDLTGLKVGNDYYAVPEAPSDLSDLDDVDDTTPTNGQVLAYDSTEEKWTPTDPAGGGDDEATEVSAAALCDLEDRMFEKKNLVDSYDQVVAGNHKKAATSFALYKLYFDFMENEEIIATALNELKALGAVASAIAPPYNASSRTFAVDDCCIYESQFYRCTTAVTTPESFDPTKWVKTLLFEEMVRRFNAL